MLLNKLHVFSWTNGGPISYRNGLKYQIIINWRLLLGFLFKTDEIINYGLWNLRFLVFFGMQEINIKIWLVKRNHSVLLISWIAVRCGALRCVELRCVALRCVASRRLASPRAASRRSRPFILYSFLLMIIKTKMRYPSGINGVIVNKIVFNFDYG